MYLEVYPQRRWRIIIILSSFCLTNLISLNKHYKSTPPREETLQEKTRLLRSCINREKQTLFSGHQTCCTATTASRAAQRTAVNACMLTHVIAYWPYKRNQKILPHPLEWLDRRLSNSTLSASLIITSASGV